MFHNEVAFSNCVRAMKGLHGMSGSLDPQKVAKEIDVAGEDFNVLRSSAVNEVYRDAALILLGAKLAKTKKTTKKGSKKKS